MRFARRGNGIIVALKEFTLSDGTVIRAGTAGGYIAHSRNLFQSGTAWVLPGGIVTGDASVSGDAIIGSSAVISGSARVQGEARVISGEVSGKARVADEADIAGSSTKIYGSAIIYGKAKVLDGAQVFERARVYGNAVVSGPYAMISASARIFGHADVRCLVTSKAGGSGVPGYNIDDSPSISGCVETDTVSQVLCDARVAGCVILRNTILDCDAIVYGDLLIEDQVINDAGYVTNCPEKKCCPD